MILPQSRWEQVHEWFSDEECEQINLAVTGDSALQKGHVINEKQLSPQLRAKVEFHFGSKKTRPDAAWRGVP